MRKKKEKKRGLPLTHLKGSEAKQNNHQRKPRRSEGSGRMVCVTRALALPTHSQHLNAPPQSPYDRFHFQPRPPPSLRVAAFENRACAAAIFPTHLLHQTKQGGILECRSKCRWRRLGSSLPGLSSLLHVRVHASSWKARTFLLPTTWLWERRENSTKCFTCTSLLCFPNE